MGVCVDTVRVDAWRYTAWFPFNGSAVKPDLIPAAELGRELYTHAGDTGMWLDFPGETVNLVARPEYASVVGELHERVLEYITL